MVASRDGMFDERDVERLIDAKTRVVSLPHITPAIGFRPPVEKIGTLCRDHGILFMLDAIQSVGAVAIDVEALPVDVIATSGHKWLCGPYGAGFMYCRSKTTRDLVPSFSAKLYTSSDSSRYDTADYDDARRWEYGSPNYSGIYGLGAALEMINEIGITKIEAHIGKMTSLLRESLTSYSIKIVTPASQDISGIFSFKVNDVGAFTEKTADAGFVLSVRGGSYIRLSPHYFNDEADIEKFIDIVATFARGN